MPFLKEKPVSDEVYYTLEDALEWDEGKRTELINGVPMMMSAPSSIHQSISMELYSCELKFAVRFACAAGGPARTAPEGLVPLDSLSPLRREFGTAIIVAAPCPARQTDGGQGG